MKRALSFSLLLSLGVLLAEVLARVLFPDLADDTAFLNRAFARLLNSGVIFDPNSASFSRQYGYVFSPNAAHTEVTTEFTYTARTNSNGFRTRELQPRRSNEYRTMLIGDSMFWGVGVEEPDMVSSVMERFGHSSVSMPHLSVYNYSVSGYNTVQELLVAKAHIDSVEPDHLVLGFFIGNDILPNAIASVDRNGNYSPSRETESRMRRQLRRRLGVLFHSLILREIALRAYVPRLRYQIASRDHVIGRSYALLAEFDQLARSKRVRFSVAILYPRDSVRGGLVEWWSNSREIGRMIGAFCHRHSIEALDLLNYMNTPEHKDKYFFQIEGHPNKEGNAVIAKAIFEDLIHPHMTR